MQPTFPLVNPWISLQPRMTFRRLPMLARTKRGQAQCREANCLSAVAPTLFHWCSSNHELQLVQFCLLLAWVDASVLSKICPHLRNHLPGQGSCLCVLLRVVEVVAAISTSGVHDSLMPISGRWRAKTCEPWASKKSRPARKMFRLEAL